MDFSIVSRTDENGAVLQVSGEVDLLTAPKLQAQVAEAIASGASAVTVDLQHVSFMDSTGLRVLVEGRERAGESKATFRLESPSKQVRRLLTLTGLDAYFDVQNTVA